MASNPDSIIEESDLSDIKRKLAWRMGFAGLMIIALLGGLALFDYLSVQSETEPPPPQFTEPVPVPKKTVTQPVTPAGSSAETKEENKEAKDAATPEASAPPVDKSAPQPDLPPKPEVAAQPALPRPSQPAARAVTPASPVSSVSPASPASPAVPAKPADAKVPPAAAAAAATLARPEATAPVQPSPPRLFSGFALQAGVFADPRRAEELHAKLTLEGIPSTIESRVQVGPFKSKEEAEAARSRLKALGVDAVLLMPPKPVRR